MRAHPSLSILGSFGKKNIAVKRIMHILEQQEIFHMLVQSIQHAQQQFVYTSSNPIWESLDENNLSFFPKKFNRSKHFHEIKGILPVFFDDLLEIFDTYHPLILKVNFLILFQQNFLKFL